MATNPLFTVTFDLASSDDYGAFLAGIRDRLGNPRHVSHGRPVLPPVEPGVPPRRWFHILLRTPASTLTLATRADILYLAGFQSADGTWWEFGHRTDRRRKMGRGGGLIPGATPLGFGGTYYDLLGGTLDVISVTLGWRQMREAVEALASRTAGAESAAEQQRPAKEALVVLLLMVHEATRFLDVATVVAGLMMRPGPDAETRTRRITRDDVEQVLEWHFWSRLLLSADSLPWFSSPGGGLENWEISPSELKHLDKEWVETAAATVGILLFVEVDNGIKADKALRLFRGNLCGKGRDGAGADVTFVVSGESIAAHRYILAGKSAVFLRQFVGRRGQGQNKSRRHVVVYDMDAATFKAVIHFIYTGTVPELDQQRRPEEEAAAVTMAACRLLEAAHKYMLDELKLICKDKLESGAIDIDMVAKILALAEQQNYRRLKARCIDFIVGTPETLHAVLATEGYKHLETSCPSVLTELLKAVHGRKYITST